MLMGDERLSGWDLLRESMIDKRILFNLTRDEDVSAIDFQTKRRDSLSWWLWDEDACVDLSRDHLHNEAYLSYLGRCFKWIHLSSCTYIVTYFISWRVSFMYCKVISHCTTSFWAFITFKSSQSSRPCMEGENCKALSALFKEEEADDARRRNISPQPFESKQRAGQKIESRVFLIMGVNLHVNM